MGISLNIGCGESKLDGFVNIDCVKNFNVDPDLILDVTKEDLPYENNSVSEIWMIHALEHVEMYKWNKILPEFLRVLEPNGILILSYPEFGECSKRFLNDSGGKRNFWRATLYGRQLYPSDYHVIPMHSPEIKEILEIAGFYRIKWQPESEVEPFNTILNAYKDPAPVKREDVLVKELSLSIGSAINFEDSL